MSQTHYLMLFITFVQTFASFVCVSQSVIYNTLFLLTRFVALNSLCYYFKALLICLRICILCLQSSHRLIPAAYFLEQLFIIDKCNSLIVLLVWSSHPSTSFELFMQQTIIILDPKSLQKRESIEKSNGRTIFDFTYNFLQKTNCYSIYITRDQVLIRIRLSLQKPVVEKKLVLPIFSQP